MLVMEVCDEIEFRRTDFMSDATPLSDATAGAIGAAIANTIVFPLDV